MRLLRLELTNFLSWAHADIDWSQLNLVAIVGHNGAGKSSLLDAVTWSLYGVARGRADQLVHEGTSRAIVRSTWLAGEHEVAITRTRSIDLDKSSLALTVDGENRTRHTIAETQAAIENLIGLPAIALLAGPIMVQGTSDALMAAGPAERKEILMRLFGLEQYEALAARAKERATATSIRTTTLAGQISSLEEHVADELTVRRGLLVLEREQAALDTELTERTTLVDTLREQAMILRDEVVNAGEVRGLLKAANARLDRAVATLAQIDREAEENRAVEPPTPIDFGSEIDRLSSQENLVRMVESMEKSADRLSIVPCGGVGIYARCPFIIEATSARDNLPDVRARASDFGEPMPIERISQQRDSLVVEARAHAVLDERHRAAREWLVKEPDVRHSLERQIEEEHTTVRELAARQLRLPQVDDEAGHVAEQLNEATVRLNQLRNRQKEVAREVGVLGERQRLIRQAQASLRDLKADYMDQLAALEKLKTLQRAFGRDGIPTLVLENGLPAIEDRANEILGRMPGSFSLHLVTQRETKLGTTRETLEVEVAVDGRERPYSLFSGGERVRVDFALRVALAGVLAARTGTPFETLWIDEGYGSQDRAGRDAMLEAVSAVSHDFGLICVVSHVEEVIDRIPTKLVVEKGIDGNSSVELVCA